MRIEAQDLTVARGTRKIIERLDFTASAGQLTVIVGPNGSGKSTLLAALSSSLTYQGQVFINGHDIKQLKPWQLAMMRGVLPQSSNMSFPFLVGEVVMLGLSHAKMDLNGDMRQKLLTQVLAHVDLAGYERHLYQQLSGGEQARVQLARVLCQIWQPVRDGMPCWLLLDEPVASLDIQHQLIVMDVARHFAAQGGGAIAILHELNLAVHYADKMVMMGEGRIAAEGNPAEVLTSTHLKSVYHCDLHVGSLPAADVPFVLPQARS